MATSGSYSDLSNKPTIPAAVAVKGNAESSYRTGNVNLTPANIGAVSTTGDTANNTVAFTSADSTTATAWTDVAALATGEKHSSIFNKVSTMFKNIRFLYKMLGTTDISSIGNGTVTGALSTLNSNLKNRYNAYKPNVITDLDIPLSNGGSTFAVNFYNSTAINEPETGSGCVLTWSSSKNYGAQFVFTDGGVYWRKNVGGTISDWQTIVS